MTDCGCEKAKAELEEYLHTTAQGRRRRHPRALANCADCQVELRVGVAITVVVQRACKESAPEDLRAQVLAKKLRVYQSTHATTV